MDRFFPAFSGEMPALPTLIDDFTTAIRVAHTVASNHTTDHAHRKNAREKARDNACLIQVHGNEALDAYIVFIQNSAHIPPDVEEIFVAEALKAQGIHKYYLISVLGLRGEFLEAFVTGAGIELFRQLFCDNVETVLLTTLGSTWNLIRKARATEQEQRRISSFRIFIAVCCGFMVIWVLFFSLRVAGALIVLFHSHFPLMVLFALGIMPFAFSFPRRVVFSTISGLCRDLSRVVTGALESSLYRWLSNQGSTIRSLVQNGLNEAILWGSCLLFFDLPNQIRNSRVASISLTGIAVIKSLLKGLVITVLRRTTFGDLEPFSYADDSKFDAERQIRLLRIKRRIPFQDLEAELVPVCLESNPRYIAISYVWDKTVPLRPLVLNDKRHYVPQNVYDILCQRSSYFRDGWIWIDFICIDQSSDGNDEKQKQIRKMRQIYEQAVSVHVCLVSSLNPCYGVSFFRSIRIWNRTLSLEDFRNMIITLQTRRHSNSWVAAQMDGFADLMNNRWYEFFTSASWFPFNFSND
jgi:hypothetical protein